MKFTVRAFVLTLAFAGVAATSASKASTPAKTTAARLTDPGNPAPVCAPRDPSACGMD